MYAYAMCRGAKQHFRTKTAIFISGKLIPRYEPRNFQSRFMGYKSGEDRQTFIETIKDIFSVVLINEYYAESLIVMRRKFCWQIKDIVYYVLHRRSYRHKMKAIKEEILRTYQEYSSVDYHM